MSSYWEIECNNYIVLNWIIFYVNNLTTDQTTDHKSWAIYLHPLKLQRVCVYLPSSFPNPLSHPLLYLALISNLQGYITKNSIFSLSYIHSNSNWMKRYFFLFIQSFNSILINVTFICHVHCTIFPNFVSYP